MEEPSQLKPERLQSRQMEPQCSAWATQYFSPLFVQLKRQFRVQTLCLCKLIIASNMLQQDVIQVVSPNAKAKQMTMKSLLHALWIAYFAHYSHQIITAKFMYR